MTATSLTAGLGDAVGLIDAVGVSVWPNKFIAANATAKQASKVDFMRRTVRSNVQRSTSNIQIRSRVALLFIGRWKLTLSVGRFFSILVA